MGMDLDRSGSPVALKLSGAIDINCAAELKTLLLEALGCGAEIRVSVEQVTGLDVTAVQLLWAAERQARQAGTGLVVAPPVPEPLSTVLAGAGFSSFAATWATA